MRETSEENTHKHTNKQTQTQHTFYLSFIHPTPHPHSLPTYSLLLHADPSSWFHSFTFLPPTPLRLTAPLFLHTLLFLSQTTPPFIHPHPSSPPPHSPIHPRSSSPPPATPTPSPTPSRTGRANVMEGDGERWSGLITPDREHKRPSVHFGKTPRSIILMALPNI